MARHQVQEEKTDAKARGTLAKAQCPCRKRRPIRQQESTLREGKKETKDNGESSSFGRMQGGPGKYVQCMLIRCDRLQKGSEKGPRHDLESLRDSLDRSHSPIRDESA